MTAEALFKAGKLDESLAALQDEIRAAPANPKLRIFLAQLLMINGTWDRAHNQLKVVGEMSSEAHLFAAIFRPLIELEAFRKAVFAGQRSPLIFGEPDPYMGKLVKALSATPDDAESLRAAALEEAPASSGKFNGKPFDWIMDADARMGPTLEVAIDRKYYWMGLHHLKSITATAPSDLRDLIWIPAEFELVNGGRLSGFIYARYPDTETSPDPAIRLSKVTEWQDAPGGSIGLGQRLLAGDQEDFPVLELRQVEFYVDEVEEDGSSGE